MKLLVFIYHFALSTLFPALFAFFVLPEAARHLFLGLWVAIWCVCYFYMDKIILFLLGAREIIDQDRQELFQQLKSETYRNFEPMPKVYLYPGETLKVFALEARGEWFLVLDRKLCALLDSEQIKALADYLVRFKKQNIAWRLTKSHGLAALAVAAIYFFWSKMAMLKPGSKVYKGFSLFSLALFKPYIEAVLLAGKSSLQLDCHISLEPVVNLGKEGSGGVDYGRFLLSNLQDQAEPRKLVARRLELFPVIERAAVKRSF